MKISPPITLWKYLARRYLVQVGMIALGLLALIYMFETFELLRRAGGHDVPTQTVMFMALLKLPETAQIIFPFVFLLSGLSLFWQLNRASELVVMRATGISAWRFVAPIALVAFACGLFNIAVLQPVGAASLSRYATLEAQYLGTPRRIAALNKQGLWVRDSHQGRVRLMHAQSVTMPEAKMTDLMILDLDDKGALLTRFDAAGGFYDNEAWVLARGMETDANGAVTPFVGKRVEAGVGREELFAGFTESGTFAFWTLPAHIKTLAESGFPTRSLVLYYQNLLATPFLWVAMTLVAVAVSLTPHRMGRTVLLLSLGVGAGFFYFLFARYFEALTLTQRIPEIVAAWVPVAIATLVPLTSLFQTEDG